MVNKYARLLEEHQICDKTGSIWTINDVPKTWRERTRAKVLSDGYHFNEEGIAVKDEPGPEPNEEPTKEPEE